MSQVSDVKLLCNRDFIGYKCISTLEYYSDYYIIIENTTITSVLFFENDQ